MNRNLLAVHYIGRFVPLKKESLFNCIYKPNYSTIIHKSLIKTVKKTECFMTGPITIIMDGAYLIKSLLFVDFEFRERELKEMGWQYITQTTSILREHAAASVLYVRVNKPIITNLYFLFI